MGSGRFRYRESTVSTTALYQYCRYNNNNNNNTNINNEFLSGHTKQTQFFSAYRLCAGETMIIIIIMLIIIIKLIVLVSLCRLGITRFMEMEALGLGVEVPYTYSDQSLI